MSLNREREQYCLPFKYHVYFLLDILSKGTTAECKYINGPVVLIKHICQFDHNHGDMKLKKSNIIVCNVSEALTHWIHWKQRDINIGIGLQFKITAYLSPQETEHFHEITNSNSTCDEKKSTMDRVWTNAEKNLWILSPTP